VIFNAKLLRVDTIADPTPGGEEAWSEGAAISIDCTLDEPSHTQRWTINQSSLDATAVLYVLMSSGIVLANGMKVVVQLMNAGVAVGSPQTLIIRSVKDRVHSPQSHYECFVRGAE